MYENDKKYVYGLKALNKQYRSHYQVLRTPLPDSVLKQLRRSGDFVEGIKPDGTSIEDLIDTLERNNERNSA